MKRKLLVLLTMLFCAVAVYSQTQPPVRETSPQSIVALMQRVMAGKNLYMPVMFTPPTLRPSLSVLGGVDTAGAIVYVRSNKLVYIYTGIGDEWVTPGAGASASYVAGQGISITGNVISLNLPFTDGRYVQLGGAYNNPSWLVTLDWNKITNKPDIVSGAVVNRLSGTANQVFVNGGLGPVSGDITLTLPQAIGLTSAPKFSSIFLNATAGNTRFTTLQTGNVNRWNIGATAEAESGSNTGSNFVINRYDDLGTSPIPALSINRNNGATIIGGELSAVAYPNLNNNFKILAQNGITGKFETITAEQLTPIVSGIYIDTIYKTGLTIFSRRSGVVTAAFQDSVGLTYLANVGTAAQKLIIPLDSRRFIVRGLNAGWGTSFLGSSDSLVNIMADTSGGKLATQWYVQNAIALSGGGGGGGPAITGLTGDVTATGPGNVPATLAATGVTPGTYGSATTIPSLAVDAKGRITSITTNTVNLNNGYIVDLRDTINSGSTFTTWTNPLFIGKVPISVEVHPNVLQVVNTTPTGNQVQFNSVAGTFTFGTPVVNGQTVRIIYKYTITNGAVDGSETKIIAGTNVTISGLGTIGSPYVINSSGGGGSGPLDSTLMATMYRLDTVKRNIRAATQSIWPYIKIGVPGGGDDSVAIVVRDNQTGLYDTSRYEKVPRYLSSGGGTGNGVNTYAYLKLKGQGIGLGYAIDSSLFLKNQNYRNGLYSVTNADSSMTQRLGGRLDGPTHIVAPWSTAANTPKASLNITNRGFGAAEYDSTLLTIKDSTQQLYESNSLFTVSTWLKEKWNDTAFFWQYNPAARFITRMEMDSTSARVAWNKQNFSPGTGGVYAGMQVYPPRDSSYWVAGRDGHSSATVQGDLDIGGGWGYNTRVLSSNGKDIPITNIRANTDFIRVVDPTRRHALNGRVANFFSAHKTYQNEINSGTYEVGDHFGTIVGFYHYGNLYGDYAGATKDKILRVVRTDTAIGFLSLPQNTPTSDVINGYGFVQQGGLDLNYMQGRLRIGGNMPLTGDMGNSVLDIYSVDGNNNNLDVIKFQKGGIYTDQYAATYNTINFGDNPINIFKKYVPDATNAVTAPSINQALIANFVTGFYKDSGPGFTITGGTQSQYAPTTVRAEFQNDNEVPQNVTGWMGNYTSRVQFAGGGNTTIANFIDYSAGVTDGGDANRKVTTRYGLFVHPKAANTTTQWGVWQDGYKDYNMFKGRTIVSGRVTEGTPESFYDLSPSLTVFGENVIDASNAVSGGYRGAQKVWQYDRYIGTTRVGGEQMAFSALHVPRISGTVNWTASGYSYDYGSNQFRTAYTGLTGSDALNGPTTVREGPAALVLRHDLIGSNNINTGSTALVGLRVGANTWNQTGAQTISKYSDIVTGAFAEMPSGKTLTDYYGLYMDNPAGVVTTAGMTITNMWGIYQPFAGMVNAFNGNSTFGSTTKPTAMVEIGASTSTRAGLVLAPGTLLSSVRNGAIENDGTNLYVTLGGVRKQLNDQSGGGGGGTPGGSNTQVQYNNSGAFAGSSLFTYNGSQLVAPKYFSQATTTGSTEYPLDIVNSSGNPIARASADGIFRWGGSVNNTLSSSAMRFANGVVQIFPSNTANQTGSLIGLTVNTGLNNSAAQTTNVVGITAGAGHTTGTAVLNYLSVTPQVTATSGFTGQINGVNVEGNVTGSYTGFVAFRNTVGNNLFNTTSGSTVIGGSAILGSSKLSVYGDLSWGSSGNNVLSSSALRFAGTNNVQIYASNSGGAVTGAVLRFLPLGSVSYNTASAYSYQVNMEGSFTSSSTNHHHSLLRLQPVYNISGTAVGNATALDIQPTWNQTAGSAPLRGIYYNPINNGITGNHFAFEAVSGKVKLNDLASVNVPTDTANYKTVVVDNTGTMYTMAWPVVDWRMNEEFMSFTSNGAGPNFNVTTANNTGSVFASADDNSNAFGTLFFQAYGNAAATSSINSRDIKIVSNTNGTYIIEVDGFQVSALNNTTDSARILVGFSNQMNTALKEMEAVAIVYDGTSAQFKCVTTAAGTETATASGVTVAANTGYKLRIEANSTTVRFYINDVLRATHTTNIPTATMQFGASIKRRLGTAFLYMGMNNYKFK